MKNGILPVLNLCVSVRLLAIRCEQWAASSRLCILFGLRFVLFVRLVRLLMSKTSCLPLKHVAQSELSSRRVRCVLVLRVYSIK